MGYELHITRESKDSENDAAEPITEAEWDQHLENDDEMQRRDFTEALSPSGEIIRINCPLCAVWTRPVDGVAVWFSYRNGRISVKNPDEVTLQKMHEIAEHLDARIHGDDGEWYKPEAQVMG